MENQTTSVGLCDHEHSMAFYTAMPAKGNNAGY